MVMFHSYVNIYQRVNPYDFGYHSATPAMTWGKNRVYDVHDKRAQSDYLPWSKHGFFACHNMFFSENYNDTLG